MLQRLLKPTERLPSRGLDIRHWTSFGQPMGRETGPSLASSSAVRNEVLRMAETIG